MEFSGSIVMTLVIVSLLFAVSSSILASKKNRSSNNDTNKISRKNTILMQMSPNRCDFTPSAKMVDLGGGGVGVGWCRGKGGA